MHAQKMIGMDKSLFLRVPKDGNLAADPEARAAVNKALGVPEKPDGYGQFQPATGALALKAEELSAFDKAMHEAGAPPASRNAALKAYHELTAAAQKSLDDAWTAQVNEGLGKLKAEWGQQYEPHLQAGEAAAKQVLGDDFAKFLSEAGIADHPTVKRAFFNLAKAIAEDGVVRPTLPGVMGETPAEAQRKIAEFQANKSRMEAMTDAAHPEHQSALAEWKRLHNVAFPA